MFFRRRTIFGCVLALVGSGFFVSCLYCHSRKRYEGYTTVTVEEMDTFERKGAKYSRMTYHLPRERIDEDVALLLGLHVRDG